MRISKLITHKLLEELLAATEEPCISLYMPTHRTHPANAQDTIRYKNLVKRVNESLSPGYSVDEIKKLMEPLNALARNSEFWNQTSDCLAVLRSPGLFEVIIFQEPMEELVIVSDSFYTKPLRHYLQSADRYQVLGLTLDTAHLFEGNRHSLVEIELPDNFPKTMTEALGEELTEEHITVASYGGVGRASASMHHGHGSKKDEIDGDTERFFRMVSKSMAEHYSKPGGLPLILASLPEHHHLFRRVNKNPLLLSAGIQINPESVSIEKLAQLSWEVMQPMYLQKIEKLTGIFNQAKSQNMSSDNLEEVIEAAEAGRVDTLMLELHHAGPNGVQNNFTDTLARTDMTQPASDDLFGDVEELVSKKGGAVLVVPKEHMPSKTGLAAIFRY